jgi:fluoride ion exporter CrcB/FEX
MLYVKVFLIAGIALGLFFHAVTQESMPWWPDTAMVGGFMGALATLIAFGHRRDRLANQRLRKVARMTWLWWRTRNNV